MQKTRDSLAAWFRNYPQQQPSLILACSLGPDSMAMTLALQSLQKEWNLLLHAVYVNHGLRKEAAQEANQFLQWARQLGLSAETVQINIPKEPSKQSAARRLRYEALVQIAQKKGAHAVVTGHTLNDQSETFIMRLLGGAGLAGLAGMSPDRILFQDHERTIHLFRPLLECSRSEVLSYLATTHQTPLQDPSNQSPDYLRSRIRHHILPVFRKERTGIDRHFSALTKQLRQDADCLEEIANEAWSRLQKQAIIKPKGAVSISIDPLKTLHPAILARVLQKASFSPLTSVQIQSLMALLHSLQGSSVVTLAQRWVAERTGGWLTFKRRPKDVIQTFPSHESVTIDEEGTYKLGFTTLKVYRGDISPGMVDNPNIAYFATSKVAPPFTLRFPRPGDRIYLPNLGGRKKISDVFIDMKVPRTLRKEMVLLCQNHNEILWIAGFRTSALGILSTPDPDEDLWIFQTNLIEQHRRSTAQ